MKKEEVKIIYCYDDNNNAIHYSKTSKGNKYYCVDCGSELICKDGEVYQKHLAHKNTDNCGGTGESIFHKHWKENLFKPGMYINASTGYRELDEVEILEVHNEVSLNKRYNKNWTKQIIVDVLLITDKGDVIVEINYKNPKNWDELYTYYEELDLLQVFEVTVKKTINSPLKWFSLDDYLEYKEEQISYESNKVSEKVSELTKEKSSAFGKTKQHSYYHRIEQDSDELFYSDALMEQVELGLNCTEEVEIYFNFKNNLKRYDSNNFRMVCLYKYNNSFKKVKLNFDVNILKLTEKELSTLLHVDKGIYTANVSLIEGVNRGYNQVLGLYDIEPFRQTDKRLYAQLCNLAKD